MVIQKYSLSELIDRRLIRFLAILLFTSLGFSKIGGAAPLLILGFALLLNYFTYRGNLLTLFFAFIFLDSYSLVWGGNWGFIFFDESSVDVSFTRAAVYLGYVITLLTLYSSKGLPKLTRLDWLILVLFSWGVLSVFWAEDYDEASEHALRFFQFIVLYFLTRVLISGRYPIQLYFKFLISCFYLLLPVIFLQYLSGYFGEGYDQGRPGDLVSFIPYVLAMLTLMKGSRVVVWVSILSSVFFASFHGSRRVLIAIFSYFSLHFNLRRIVLVGLIIIFTIGPLLLELLPQVTLNRIEQTFDYSSQVLQGQVDDKTLDKLGTNRWSLWQKTLAIWSRNPIFGVGLKNHVKLMDDYGYRGEARAHNFYLEVLADLGIVGFLIILLVVQAGFSGLKSINLDSNKITFFNLMVRAYRYNFIVIHIVALVGSSMFYNKGAWIVYGLIGSLQEFNNRKWDN